MKKCSLKGVLALTLSALLALSLCACGTPAQDDTQSNEDNAVVENNDANQDKAPVMDNPVAVEKDAYTLSLPEGYTSEDAADGGLKILDADGNEAGGVKVIPCQGADNLKVGSEADLAGEGYKVLAEQVAPGAEGTFSIGDYGMFTYTEAGGVHTFFPKGDNLYDLWLLNVPAETAAAIQNSFAAK